MFTEKKINLINYLISFLPLSIILGNLILNINIILVCFFGLLIYGKKTFLIEKKNYQILIYTFFFYLILITLINNLPNYYSDSLYKDHILKSLFYLRFLLFFLIINKLIETKSLDIKLFFYSAAFFSFLVSFDILIQVILKKNLIGYQITWDRPSSFFGDEHIAGGYLQKFILFFIFLCAYKLKSNFKVFLLFIFFLIPIILTLNRMPVVIYLSSVLLFYLLEKRIKFIFLVLIFSISIFFSLKKYSFVNTMDSQITAFVSNTINIIFKSPNLFMNNNNYEVIKSDSSGYLLHFNSGVQAWKKNKIFGQGLKSFRLNCEYADTQTCNTHPHNYFIEIMLDTGLVGLTIIYSFFIIGLINFLKFYLNQPNKIKLFTLPFFIICFFEFFPLRSTGSFFTTSNSAIIFLSLAIFINSEKLKNLIAKKKLLLK